MRYSRTRSPAPRTLASAHARRVRRSSTGLARRVTRAPRAFTPPRQSSSAGAPTARSSTTTGPLPRAGKASKAEGGGSGSEVLGDTALCRARDRARRRVQSRSGGIASSRAPHCAHPGVSGVTSVVRRPSRTRPRTDRGSDRVDVKSRTGGVQHDGVGPVYNLQIRHNFERHPGTGRLQPGCPPRGGDGGRVRPRGDRRGGVTEGHLASQHISHGTCDTGGGRGRQSGY